MTTPAETNPLDVEGAWSIDTRCIGCDVARHWAPDLVGQDDDGLSFIARQPETAEEQAQLWRAAVACPTQSIRNRNARRPDEPPFPFELAPGVLALGHNSRKSFGGHSYLAVRDDGNVLFDSPRFERALVERVAELGGVAHILLSHRDDVADYARWADRFGARVWIHAADADAAPKATDIIEGSDPTTIAPGVVALLAPGHTEGHLVFHLDERLLFTGDTLHWNHRRGELDVTPIQTWFGWEALAETMDMLAGLRVEWVFAGHGSWRHMGFDAYAAEMRELGPAMREVGRYAWAERPGTSFDWYPFPD
ncbi:MAG: MBL fold metallo-hydrolase [Chloroflexi bacterium]|nr:MBL fold metallo-hydrolase [Chloroflexota bacterium]